MRWSLGRLVPDIKNGQVVFIQARELLRTRQGIGGSVFGSAYNYDLFIKDEEIVIQPRLRFAHTPVLELVPLRYPNNINYYEAFLIERNPAPPLYSREHIHLKFSDEVAYEDLISSPNLFGIFIHA